MDALYPGQFFVHKFSIGLDILCNDLENEIMGTGNLVTLHNLFKFRKLFLIKGTEDSLLKLSVMLTITMMENPTFSGSTTAVKWDITPAVSRRFTRSKVAGAEIPTILDNLALVILPFS